MVHRWWGKEISTATWKTAQKFIRKLKTELPSAPTSGYKSEGNKVGRREEISAAHVHGQRFPAVKLWKQSSYLSVGEWIGKYSPLHNGITFCYETEGNPATYDNKDEPGGHHAKSDRKTDTACPHLWVESKIFFKRLNSKETETRTVVSKEGGGNG